MQSFHPNGHFSIEREIVFMHVYGRKVLLFFLVFSMDTS